MTTVAIAGATGKTGGRLAERLGARFAVRRLGSGTNLLSLADAEAALAGAQVGVYLARAAKTGFRMVQAKPADLDLLMADSFARAAARCGLTQLVHFRCGPNDERVAVLEASGVPVTVVDTEEALDAAVTAAPGAAPSSALVAPKNGTHAGICSLQRLPVPKGWTAEQAARAYFEWAGTHLPGVGRQITGDALALRAFGAEVLCLSLIRGRTTPTSAVLQVGGGLMAGRPAGDGVFEFRIVATAEGPRLFTNLMGYVPALPWPLYRVTQAPMHGWVMARFGRWLTQQ